MIEPGAPVRFESLLPADGLAALTAKAQSADRLQLLFDLLAPALGQTGYEASARAFVTELATRLHCDRVTLGTVLNGRVRLTALSHSSTFSPKTTLVRAITWLALIVVALALIADPTFRRGLVAFLDEVFVFDCPRAIVWATVYTICYAVLHYTRPAAQQRPA